MPPPTKGTCSADEFKLGRGRLSRVVKMNVDRPRRPSEVRHARGKASHKTASMLSAIDFLRTPRRQKGGDGAPISGQSATTLPASHPSRVRYRIVLTITCVVRLLVRN